MASLQLVYASAPADEALRAQLSAHLHALVQGGLISEWHEQLIPVGADRTQERHRAWHNADILLLLLSSDYFLSDAFNEQEIQQALERQRLGQLLVIPILLRPCDWRATIVGHLQSLPRNEKPVTGWEDQDAAWLSIAQNIRQYVTSRTASRTLLSPVQRTNRQRLLKQVRTLWIDGLLEQSLHRAVWVDLHLQQQPDALENPWHLVVQELAHEPRPLPAGTSIIQVFDEADEELLILGEPGSGKTTLLLYLARTLLDRADADESRRIPVIFHLSSWPQQRLPLDQWLVAELKTKYQVSRQVGQAWVETDQIFPLLDGLDEVAESARTACVQAIINHMQRSPARTPLVVCCRNAEYQALSLQLPLQYAVMLLPFSREQIDTYLSSVSGQVESLRQALNEDKELFELARRPLLLSIFTLAYHGASPAELPMPTAQHDYPQALFAYYVKHMLGRRTHLQRGTEEQVYRWLTYLAAQLQQHQQTLLAIEYLQPTWLPARFQRWYRRIMPLVYALTFGLVLGPIFGAGFGLVYGIIYRTSARLIFGLLFGLIVGLMGGLVGGLIFGITFKQHHTIQPAEDAGWSWTSATKGLGTGVAGGLVVGLAGGLLGASATGPLGGLVVGLAATLLVGLVGGLVGGLSPLQLSERITLTPNAGIWRSGKRGLFYVVLCVLLFGLAGGLIFALLAASIGSLTYALLFGMVFGAPGGLIFGLAFGLVGGRTGLAAFLQHFVLRFFLWRLGLLPWGLVAFLDEATERLLLRKIGGSYIFVHRLLRDTLAAKNTRH
ncbi:MAG TPA: NACHT domain-containing protein [Ktedonobacteraceae bacterium]|nr:NACHT domain-containing protein [Ktedonobacteraceae bacterium]